MQKTVFVPLRRLRLVLHRFVIGALVCALCTSATSAVSLFAAIAAGLKKSAVPVLLPDALSADDLHGLRAELRWAGAGGYRIDLDYAADCNGATACYLGSITGRRADSTNPAGDRVRLPGGMVARYVEGACGASCSDSTFTFDVRGNRYVFAAKGATEAYLAKWGASIVTLDSMYHSIRSRSS